MNNISTIHRYECDIQTGVLEASVRKPLHEGDALADMFCVSLKQGDEPVNLDGMGVYGRLHFSFPRRTVLMEGFVDDNAACVLLNSDCYAITGDAVLTIQLKAGDVYHTVLKVDVDIARTGIRSAALVGPLGPTLADLFAQRVQLKPEFANSIADCTDTSKLYVLPDNFIYAYMYAEGTKPEIAIMAKADGYYQTNGDWNANDTMCCKHTNMIPVTPGDIFGYKGRGKYGAASAIWYDSNGLVLSYEQYDSESSVTTVTVPDGASSVMFSSFKTTENPDSVVLAVEWIECAAAKPGYYWSNTGHAFVPADAQNVLNGKKVVFDGDSICEGTSASTGSGWASRIGEANEMTWHNVGVGGGTITSGTTNSGGANRHWVSTNINDIYASYPDLDYLILEGGTNDADILGQDGLGAISNTDVLPTAFDPTADFTQALEYLLSKAISLYPTVRIGFIVAHKMGTVNDYSESIRRKYFDRCVEVCKKYGIPCLDLWNTCHLHPRIDYASHGNAYHMYTDGQHLSDAGYDYISPIIEAWMKTI